MSSGYRQSQRNGPGWFEMFSANFAGTLLAGIILIVGMKLYVESKIEAAGENLKKQWDSERKR